MTIVPLGRDILSSWRLGLPAIRLHSSFVASEPATIGRLLAVYYLAVAGQISGASEISQQQASQIPSTGRSFLSMVTAYHGHR